MGWAPGSERLRRKSTRRLDENGGSRRSFLAAKRGGVCLQIEVVALSRKARKNALLKVGNKSDRIDARKLAELLRSNLLRPVYHGEHGVRTLKELSRSYLAISGDLARVMTRLKAVCRSWAIPYAGKQVYAPRYRALLIN